jgi:hypothetical protein
MKARIYEHLDKAKIAFYNHEYAISILLCGKTIEQILHLAYKKIIPEISDSKLRLKLVESEIEFGHGSLNRITLGGWSQIFTRHNLLVLMEELFNIDLREAKSIDFKMLAQFRNKAAHILNEEFKVEAGYCIFQTSLLVEGLKSIINDNYTKDRELYIQDSKNLPITYLKIKIDNIKPKPTESIDKNLNDAIQISEINPEDAIVKLRKSLELLLRDLCDSHGLKHKGLSLDELMKKLSEKNKIPNKEYKQMEIVRQFGNRGVHPEGESYNVNDLEIVFFSFILIVEWYLRESFLDDI